MKLKGVKTKIDLIKINQQLNIVVLSASHCCGALLKVAAVGQSLRRRTTAD